VGGFAGTLRALMDDHGISSNMLARQLPCDKALISRYRSGRQEPSQRMARRIDDVLGAGGQLAALARRMADVATGRAGADADP
jgi:ribosome-binding protein aMBF1 (putative translation factor)